MLIELPNQASRDCRCLGRWCGDSIAIVEQEYPLDWEQFKSEYVDIAANAILTVYHEDGFDQIGKQAEQDQNLFLELCHLVVSSQAIELEPHMMKWFGKRYLGLYDRSLKTHPNFEPKNIV